MDLEDKELKATRKLNGVAKDSNIEIIEDFIHQIKDFELNKDVVEIVNALEDILEEREADKKKIAKLQEKLLDMIEGTEIIKKETTKETVEYIKENYIPVQKVKDKIEENKDTAKRVAGTYQYADSGDDLEEKKSKVIELRTKAEALEELLEDK